MVVLITIINAKSFELQSWTHTVPVTVADGLPIDIDEEVLLGFPAFDD
jgi:hypothetical protein